MSWPFGLYIYTWELGWCGIRFRTGYPPFDRSRACFVGQPSNYRTRPNRSNIASRSHRTPHTAHRTPRVGILLGPHLNAFETGKGNIWGVI